MIEVIQLVLPAALAVSVAAGAIIAAWRLIPTKHSPTVALARLESLEEAVEAIRLSNIELTDKYEITIRRNNVRVGRLRSKLTKLRGEDDDDFEDEPQEAHPEPASPSPGLPAPAARMSKAEMWATAEPTLKQMGLKQ